jgi:predicted RNA-binding protein (virulence factor B family)
MKPLTTTKDEYSGKYIAWHLPKDKVVALDSESKSQVFWKCTNRFYLIGVGETKKKAVSNLESKIYNFISWLIESHSELEVEGISSNLSEYRQAIYEYNTKKLF